MAASARSAIERKLGITLDEGAIDVTHTPRAFLLAVNGELV